MLADAWRPGSAGLAVTARDPHRQYARAQVATSAPGLPQWMQGRPGSDGSIGRNRIVALVFALTSASQAASPHHAPTQKPPLLLDAGREPVERGDLVGVRLAEVACIREERGLDR